MSLLDGLKRDELPVMPAAVSKALDEWLIRTHGVYGSAHQVGLFLDLLSDNGYTVERSTVADARSYTTVESLEIDRRPEDDTRSLMVAEDPTWTPPSDPDAPVRSLG